MDQLWLRWLVQPPVVIDNILVQVLCKQLNRCVHLPLLFMVFVQLEEIHLLIGWFWIFFLHIFISESQTIYLFFYHIFLYIISYLSVPSIKFLKFFKIYCKCSICCSWFGPYIRSCSWTWHIFSAKWSHENCFSFTSSMPFLPSWQSACWASCYSIENIPCMLLWCFFIVSPI